MSRKLNLNPKKRRLTVVESEIARKIEEERKKQQEKDKIRAQRAAKKKAIRLASLDTIEPSSPGPGWYNIEKSDKIVLESHNQPPFSPTKRSELAPESFSPVPGRYNPERGNSLTLPNSPATIFGKSKRDGNTRINETPGPGFYDNVDTKKSHIPTFKLGQVSGNEKRGWKHENIGPGEYDLGLASGIIFSRVQSTYIDTVGREDRDKVYFGNSSLSSISTSKLKSTSCEGEYICAVESIFSHPLYKGIEHTIAGKPQDRKIERPEISKSVKSNKTQNSSTFHWLRFEPHNANDERSEVEEQAVERAEKVIFRRSVSYSFNHTARGNETDIDRKKSPGPKYQVQSVSDIGKEFRGPTFPKANRIVVNRSSRMLSTDQIARTELKRTRQHSHTTALPITRCNSQSTLRTSKTEEFNAEEEAKKSVLNLEYFNQLDPNDELIYDTY